MFFMLLTKKNKFLITEAQIKEDLLAQNGDVLLKINIKYPDIRCGKNDPLNNYAVGFYNNLAKSFSNLAKTELLAAANTAYTANADTFLPYAAVIKYEMTLQNADFLSVITDISVSDGVSTPSLERKTQVWDRKNGTLCRMSDFIAKEKTEELIKKYGKTIKRNELFVLRDNNIEMFVANGNGYISISENI